jgi:hypothetical protein
MEQQVNACFAKVISMPTGSKLPMTSGLKKKAEEES